MLRNISPNILLNYTSSITFKYISHKQQMFGSNLGLDTCYPEISSWSPQSHQEYAGIVLRLGEECFLPHFSQFITRRASHSAKLLLYE
jgi:hypothetical protein